MNGELKFSGYRASVWDEKVLGMGSGESCPIMCTVYVLNVTGL